MLIEIFNWAESIKLDSSIQYKFTVLFLLFNKAFSFKSAKKSCARSVSPSITRSPFLYNSRVSASNCKVFKAFFKSM